MTEVFALELAKDSLIIVLKIAGPLLLSGLLIGLLIGIFQAVTSIQEMTLTFVPKMIFVGIVFLILMPWFLKEVVQFTRYLFEVISTL